VLRAAGAACVELVSPRAGPNGPPPLAFEFGGPREVDAIRARFAVDAGEPHRYPRGHYGFEAPGPAAARIMIWSER
jgi:hypothetical protein